MQKKKETAGHWRKTAMQREEQTGERARKERRSSAGPRTLLCLGAWASFLLGQEVIQAIVVVMGLLSGLEFGPNLSYRACKNREKEMGSILGLN